MAMEVKDVKKQVYECKTHVHKGSNLYEMSFSNLVLSLRSVRKTG